MLEPPLRIAAGALTACGGDNLTACGGDNLTDLGK